MIIHGNNIEILKSYPDNYFDAVVTDPPYGLGKEPDAVELMKDWVEKGYHEIKGSGFMGKEWDAFVPQPNFWKEVFRVLKHGGHVLSFFGTRTYDWGVMAMRFAGFEVRDCIYWHYGSGFPKSHNISKAINKINGVEFEEKPASGVGFMKADSEDWNITKNQLIQKGESCEQAKKWVGWGSALKPATEPIVLARKPLEKGLSIAENVLKWGTGAINIDGCRVGNIGGTERGEQGKRMKDTKNGFRENSEVIDINKGRFPANLILTHHPDCECKGLKKVKGTGGYETEGETKHWECVDDCPIKIMDEQSGILKSGRLNSDSYVKERDNNSIFAGGGIYKHKGYLEDSGGASRFFYVAKASKSERNRGLDEFKERQTVGGGGGIGDYAQDVNSASGKYGSEKAPNKNFHPTVKPVKLMQYLVRLVTQPNGKVLDPFCGSGTTGIACKLYGFEFVGIEQDQEYCKIAEARIKNYQLEKEKLNKINTNKKDQPTLF